MWGVLLQLTRAAHAPRLRCGLHKAFQPISLVLPGRSSTSPVTRATTIVSHLQGPSGQVSVQLSVSSLGSGMLLWLVRVCVALKWLPCHPFPEHLQHP